MSKTLGKCSITLSKNIGEMINIDNVIQYKYDMSKH